jgi:Skp family chaperone for outer membrane proteins
MKTKKMFTIVLLVSIIAIVIGNTNTWARIKAEIMPAKVAVVGVREILEKNQKNADWERKIKVDGDKVTAQLQGIQAELVQLKDEMDTVKQGSPDYLGKLQKYMETQALLEAKDKYYQQEFAMRQQIWAEEHYLEVVKMVGQVAKARGLDIVLAKEENTFPAPSPSELMLVIKTSKVLYASDTLDITQEVLTAVNNSK